MAGGKMAADFQWQDPLALDEMLSEEERLAIGLTEGCVRLSVGLEGLSDLWRDIERALEAA